MKDILILILIHGFFKLWSVHVHAHLHGEAEIYINYTCNTVIYIMLIMWLSSLAVGMYVCIHTLVCVVLQGSYTHQFRRCTIGYTKIRCIVSGSCNLEQKNTTSHTVICHKCWMECKLSFYKIVLKWNYGTTSLQRPGLQKSCFKMMPQKELTCMWITYYHSNVSNINYVTFINQCNGQLKSLLAVTGKTGPWQPRAEEWVNEEGGRGEGKEREEKEGEGLGKIGILAVDAVSGSGDNAIDANSSVLSLRMCVSLFCNCTNQQIGAQWQWVVCNCVCVACMCMCVCVCVCVCVVCLCVCVCVLCVWVLIFNLDVCLLRYICNGSEEEMSTYMFCHSWRPHRYICRSEHIITEIMALSIHLVAHADSQVVPSLPMVDGLSGCLHLNTAA